MRFATRSIAAVAAVCFAAGAATAQTKSRSPIATMPGDQAHMIGAVRLVIGDIKENQVFFEKVFGMKEVGHFSGKDLFDEPVMGFDSGAWLALLHPLAEAPIKKSQYPVALIYTPDLDGTVKRLEANQYKFQRLPQTQGSTFNIAIARDPSGNAIEIFAREGKAQEVGGAKLIVDDRQKAEDFFVRIFGAKPGQRYKTATYDEVIMSFGEGPFLALFQPLNEAPLPKSRFPVALIYTKEFDAVLKRVTEAGFGYRELKTNNPNSRTIVAKDPAGNGIEIAQR